MSSSDVQARLGDTLVDFSSRGIFPDEEAISAASVTNSALPAALEALEKAKAELENDIRQLSRDSAPDVDSWIANAKSLQDDIEASRKLAVEVVQQAAADEHQEETIKEREIYESFLTKETNFNAQLLAALRLIEGVNGQLDKAEQLIEDRSILDALQILEDVGKTMANVPTEKTTRAMRLLEQRNVELRALAHEHLSALWTRLIHVDYGEKIITVNQSLGDSLTLNDTIIALNTYKELDKVAYKLSQAVLKVIFLPRTDMTVQHLPSIKITQESLALGADTVEPTIEALFRDFESVIRFLAQTLPKQLIVPLSQDLMPGLATHVKEVWLDAAVPSTLDNMPDYQKSLAQVSDFAEVLKSLEWPGVDSFNDWVQHAPRIWLAKRREDSLDEVRNGLSLAEVDALCPTCLPTPGVGNPQVAYKVETRNVLQEETPVTANQDWDDAWNSDEETEPHPDPIPISNGHDKAPTDDQENVDLAARSASTTEPAGEDDAADAWGWGEDEDMIDDLPSDTAEVQISDAPQQPVPPPSLHGGNGPREVTMSEQYWTSSMPQPIMKVVEQIFNDGAKLLKPENEHLPVAPAAAPIFLLPTLILALYRSIGPLYYGHHESGNLFVYNDTLWLSDQLRDFVTQWKARTDLPPRALTLVRLDNEITILESFGKRAYTSELNAQRTVIKDLLGGAQNFFEDDGFTKEVLVPRINIVIKHIRSKAKSWERILSPSVLSSALGALVNSVASRLVNDVFDVSSMSIPEADATATVISLVESLDDLFLPKQQGRNQNGAPELEQIPLTSQYADQWMKMKFMSQTLQSNLPDIHYLWFESDLSLYFTPQEVVDLIELSFENNPQVRSEIRQIREQPNPRG